MMNEWFLQTAVPTMYITMKREIVATILVNSLLGFVL